MSNPTPPAYLYNKAIAISVFRKVRKLDPKATLQSESYIATMPNGQLKQAVRWFIA